MKAKSVSGLGFYVQDIARTAEFYEALGFRVGERTDDYLKIYLSSLQPRVGERWSIIHGKTT